MNMDDSTLPETGELIVATITRVTPYGAYGSLDEYNNIEGLLHISEVSSRWVKNIKNHVREGQKVVLKVLRVDASKLHVLLSLRRVNEREKREKLLRWKQENRGMKLLSLAAEKMGVTEEDGYEGVGKLIEDSFENIYQGLEEAAKSGESILIKCGVPPDWATMLTVIAKTNIRIPKMQIRGVLELTSTQPDGVTILKDALTKAKKLKGKGGNDVNIYVIGAPRYRVEVTSDSYKKAEQVLERVVNNAIKIVEGQGGKGKFTRGLSKKA